ncbi:beta-propeller domain-containing protein [Pendulispora rubella]|uniref:beta-propeller domain-containing protein n=1 Tax=Pendulispora rubella TaxID=2741070 RepID=UPI0030E3AF15
MLALVGGAVAVPACSSSSHSGPEEDRNPGQSDFISAPPGASGTFGSPSGSVDAGAPTSDQGGGKGGEASNPPRKVEETDLYRVEGDRLYYLNAYRGLMVFDVSNVDQPRLVGRSSIHGSPVEMFIRNGIATIVVADWYGTMEDGSPFHGSIVRGLDATNPGDIKVLGEAKLGGWVRDTRIVGDVLYAVSEDYGWYYGWDAVGASTTSSHGPKVVVSSVNFAGGVISQKGSHTFDGYSSVFNVTDSSIMLAHDIPSDPSQPWSQPTGRSELVYLDISDPLGTIGVRGRIEVNGSVQGWGADNGRWNIDFADKRYAHLLGCGGAYCGGQDGRYVLSTVDFQNPDVPVRASELTIPSTGWSVTARFDGARMYLSPGSYYYYGNNGTTPFQIYDISNPSAPKLAGQTSVQGGIWNFIPSGDRLFALGNEYGSNSNKVALQYFNVSNPAAPTLIGKSTFGDGWAWTPAAGTFKAFVKDADKGLVVLPFSGWSSQGYEYRNGLQLIEFTADSIRTAGAARSHGWVERGIFVKGRLVSLSDQSLSVVDYANKANPQVVKEVTLARNVVDARPDGNTVAEVSTDWWGYDDRQSEIRMLPMDNADERSDASGAVTVKIDGNNARVFRNGPLSYVVTNVRKEIDCGDGRGNPAPTPDGKPSSGACYAYVPQVQVVEFAHETATLRGKVTLPTDSGNSYYYGGWGWGGCYWYDWFGGSDVVQVEGNALAFRRFYPKVKSDGTWDANQTLYVVDITNPDAPNLTSTDITSDRRSWWGNMRAVGDKLYTSHYEWISWPVYDPQTGRSSNGTVRYYLDQIDLSDRAHPRVGSRINVPGLLVGASETDPSLLYFTDYRWWNGTTRDDLSVARIVGRKAYLQSSTVLDGYVGNVFVRGSKAYASVQRYDYQTGSDSQVTLHEFDLTDPRRPIDRRAPAQRGWGWLLGVEGDRAIVTSGWGSGIDIYRLQPNAAPTYDRFVRAQGWPGSISRQNDTLFLASGYWGIQSIQLH